jgi:hypothetical protein
VGEFLGFGCPIMVLIFKDASKGFHFITKFLFLPDFILWIILVILYVFIYFKLTMFVETIEKTLYLPPSRSYLGPMDEFHLGCKVVI